MNYNMKDRYGNVIEEVSTDRLYRRITLGELREAKRERQTRITRAVRGPPITGVLQRIYDDFAKEERDSNDRIFRGKIQI